MKTEKKYGMVIGNICTYDETFEEFFPGLIWGMQETNKTWTERKSPPDENPYFVFKSELETLLTTRDIDEIEEVMVKSENSRYIDRDKNARFFERIYHEIYKDDPEYKPELVQTPIEELLKMHF